MMRFLAVFWRMEGGQRRLVLESLSYLLLARLWLLLPLRWLVLPEGPCAEGADPPTARRLQLSGFGLQLSGCADGAAPQAAARRVGAMVARVARHLPIRAACLQQAFAAGWMLRRRGMAAVLHLGVARDGGAGLRAHAWLTVGGCLVTGAHDSFTPIARFLLR